MSIGNSQRDEHTSAVAAREKNIPLLALPITARDAALRLIADEGIKGLSTPSFKETMSSSDQISRFKKRDLIVSLLIDNRESWDAQVRASLVRRAPGEYALIHLFDGISSMFSDQEIMRGRLRLVFETLALKDPIVRNALRQLRNAMISGIEELLESGIRSGQFQHADVNSMTTVINCACKGIGYQWVFDQKSVDIGSAFRELEMMVTFRLGKHH